MAAGTQRASCLQGPASGDHPGPQGRFAGELTDAQKRANLITGGYWVGPGTPDAPADDPGSASQVNVNSVLRLRDWPGVT